jgi:hypothetical protein
MQKLIRKMTSEHAARLKTVVGVKEQEQAAVLEGALTAQKEEIEVR